MKNINIPGAVWVILAALLMTFQDQLKLQFPAAEWLPIAVAVIGCAAKWIQVNTGSSEKLPEVESDYYPPSATPMATLEETKPSKAIQFLVG